MQVLIPSTLGHRLTASFLALYLVLPQYSRAADQAAVDIFSLSLEQLMTLRIESSAALTPTSLARQPAAVSVISEAQLRDSGATNPDDLMELYVPNMQMLQTTFYGRAIGFRGVQLVRGERYLLMVDGQPMNFQVFDGAVSERQLPLMGDLKEMTVVRGPGSFLYGPGAEIATINLVTHDGLSSEGASVRSQYNAIDKLRSLESRFGQRLTDDSGLFLYAGIADYEGPEYRDAPIYFGHSFTSFWGPVQGGTPAAVLQLPAVNGSDKAQKKLFARYDNGNFKAWLRYTDEHLKPSRTWAALQDGPATHLPALSGITGANPAVDLQWFFDRGYEDHEQLMAVLNYRQIYSDALQWEYHLAYHETRYRWLRPQTLMPLEFRRNEYTDDGHTEAKIIGTWQPSQGHALAFGVEAKHQPYTSTRAIEGGAVLLPFQADWTTSAQALMLEDQWQLTDSTSSFIGVRADKHSYTDWLFSSRVALVHELSEQDTLKVIAARSLRKPMEILMLLERRAEPGKMFEPETFDSFELRFEREQSKALSVDGSLVLERINAFDTSLNGNQSQAGQYEIGALELALHYQTDDLHIVASHGYSKLLSAEQNPNVPVTVITVADAKNGRGSDLGFWSSHISKLALLYDVRADLKLSTSLVHYWGFPGIDDFSRWTTDNAGGALPGTTYRRYGLYDGSNTRTAAGNTYLNIGIKWQLAPELSLSLDGYNLLGLVDEAISKRNFIGENAGSYQIDPASFGIRLDYNF